MCDMFLLLFINFIPDFSLKWKEVKSTETTGTFDNEYYVVVVEAIAVMNFLNEKTLV